MIPNPTNTSFHSDCSVHELFLTPVFISYDAIRARLTALALRRHQCCFMFYITTRTNPNETVLVPPINSMMNLFVLILALDLGFVSLVHGVPSGFIDETVSDISAITGAFAPNPRKNGKPMLLLSTKLGKIFVLEDPDNSDNKIVVADFESRMCHDGERGLQSIRPHPNFNSNRYIYMFYTSLRSGCAASLTNGPPNRLSRFTMNADTLKIDSSTELILMETAPSFKNIHNGGSIAFGNDGKLWVTTGDSGNHEAGVPQDLGHLNGKILRLNDDGSIPSDNPYASGGVKCAKNGGKTNNGICGEM